MGTAMVDLPKKSSSLLLVNGGMVLANGIEAQAAAVAHHNNHHHHHHVKFADEQSIKPVGGGGGGRVAAVKPPLELLKLKNSCEEDEEESEEEEEEWILEEQVEEVEEFGRDERDVGTSDEWVSRHPDMVRLTGRHPFNAEPPLPRLMQHGFITPAALHYVRNHGPVPRGTWAEWRIHVGGMVRRPAVLTMDDLLRLPARELPVTLVCAGNRRKEQNMVRQSVGFNWGAAGVSTSVWKGALLRDVLKACGGLRRGARFVCFEGGDSLPKCGGDGYGTGIRAERAMDVTQDVLVAYMQNGRPLPPDHGFPVRMIIPGMIGGRMVKWLRKIEATAAEPNNFYHYQDNKVLPSHVDSDIANAEGWWKRPEYLINELNINSVITTPAHGDSLPINPVSIQSPYRMRGYAYSGGGRKVTRVEVTLDGGETWALADLKHPERPTKYGKHWCWCFWELGVEAMELLQAREIAVRAWDESMNTQPKELIWNLMGMMNNCWFRVKVRPCKGKLGGVALAFEHPTRPANQPGGWMVKQKEEETKSGDLSKPGKAMTKSASSPFLNQSVSSITMSEVRKHSKPDSPWIVVNSSVYDCTSFLKDHPGGADSILINAGTDCTEEFEAIHSARAKALLEDYKIGELVSTAGSFSSADTSPETSLHGGNRALSALSLTTLDPILEALPASRPVALNPRQNIPCKLVARVNISADLRRLRFSLPSPDQVLGLPTGKHVFVSAAVNSKLCIRAYTPISSDDDEDSIGHVELLIRVYYKNVHPNFPGGGIMSQHLDSLAIGDSINLKGPIGHIQYLGRGKFTVNGDAKFASDIAMLAGGTGITPVYQVIKAILRDKEDTTRISLVYANRTEEDIMLRAELDSWAESHAAQFRVWYVLSQPREPSNWKYSVGYITEEVVRDHLARGSDEAAAFMCGPPAMINLACLPNLAKHGYSKSSCYQF
ncbi:nitrate reductase [NADH] [Selaginella moellendorffii]|nr:nitrate reductase [NADH] [Selaginella moellendorffii]|eukprot:XP_024545152.1 nitrate reductase [NADH] [Selaginella moellendorffii]